MPPHAPRPASLNPRPDLAWGSQFRIAFFDEVRAIANRGLKQPVGKPGRPRAAAPLSLAAPALPAERISICLSEAERAFHRDPWGHRPVDLADLTSESFKLALQHPERDGALLRMRIRGRLARIKSIARKNSEMHRPMRDVVREELLEYDLADLLPAEAAVIELYYERFSQSDIAREYGISQATVSRLLRSAMTKQSKKYFSEAA